MTPFRHFPEGTEGGKQYYTQNGYSPRLYSYCHIPYSSDIQPGLCVPPGVREDIRST